MQIRISHHQADMFQTIFQNIRAFSPTIVLLWEEHRLFMQTMDSSHVSVVEMVLPSTWFAEYVVSKATRVAFDVTLFAKILSTRDKVAKQDIVIGLEEDIMTVTMYSDTERGSSVLVEKHFTLPLMEMDQDLLGIPETDYDAEFSLLSTDFAEWVGQLRLFGDQLNLKCSEEAIWMKSTSVEKGGMEAKIDIDKLVSYAINEGETVQLSYSLTYMAHIAAFHKLATHASLRVKTASPLLVEYDLGEGGAYMRFYLAPKYNDDDEE